MWQEDQVRIKHIGDRCGRCQLPALLVPRLRSLLRDFTALGKLKNRFYVPARAGKENQAILAAHFHLAPDQQ